MAIQKTLRTLLAGAGMTALILLAGCASKQEKAIDQAKAQAISTNIPQQVQYIDSDGNTVTKTVQPPYAKGQQPAISTLISPPPPGSKPHSTDPTITPLGSYGQPQPYGNGQPDAAEGGQPGGQPGMQPNQPPPVSIQIPAGTELAIRIDQRISVKTSRAGDHFNGNVVEPIVSNGSVVIPRGTEVAGRVDEAHRRGHFKGRSFLELRLTSMTLGGYEYPIDTRDNVQTKRGKGRRSAAIIGGMTGAGMLIGGLATGGVGLAIGAAAGAGTGTAIAGLTGNSDINIPAESVVHFRLADPLIVHNP